MMEAISKLTENSPLALIVIGVVLLVIAATGGVPLTTSVINGLGWQLTLIAIGAGFCGLGGFLLWSTNHFSGTINPGKYNIKITNLKDGNQVGKYFTLAGTYSKEPPRGYVIGTAELNASNGSFRPRRIAIKGKDRSWRAEQLYAGEESGKERIVLVGLLGPAGKVIFDYWDKVGQTYNYDKRPSIEKLDEVFFECDRVSLCTKL